MKGSRATGAVGAAATAIAISLMASACGGQAPNAPAATGESGEESLSIGLFVANAFGDQSYYDSARAVTEPLERDYGATVTTYEGKLQTQNYAPLLQDAADANELVYVLGNQAIDATVEAAAQNPDTTYVFVNGVVPSEDAVSVSFRYQESCYVGGTIAALVSAAEQATAVGFMGGFQAPSIADCEAGYTQGVSAQDPALRVVSRYVGSFSDPPKGLETATAIAQEGAYVLYSTAGLSGQGAVEAASSGTRLAPIMASYPDVPEVSPAVVNDNTGVLMLEAAEAYTSDALERGDVRDYGFAEGAFDVQFNDAFLAPDQQAAVEDVIEQIEAGEITPQAAPR